MPRAAQLSFSLQQLMRTVKNLPLSVLFLHLFPLQHQASGSELPSVAASSRLASAFCGVYDAYKESGMVPNDSLQSPPSGVPLLAAPCDTFVRHCVKSQCTEWTFGKGSKCKSSKESRIIGGQNASASDAPWDVNLKYIFDWGSSLGDPNRYTEKEKAENDVKSIKEQHRCTGIFYKRNYIVSTGWCGYRGEEFSKTRNRFVAWIARRRFLFQEWCRIKSNENKESNCKIDVHPKFRAVASGSKNPGIQDRDYDVSILKFFKPFNFKTLQFTKAIPFAQKGQEFSGEAIFAGWGTTIENLSYTQVGSGGQGGQKQRPGYTTILQKITLTIVPFKPQCEELVHWYIEKGAGVAKPGTDYSKIYMCAKPRDGRTQGLCGGDVGGALVCKDKGKQYVCGMRNSWGATENCLRDDDQLEVFLKISHVIDWIKGIAGEQAKEDLNP